MYDAGWQKQFHGRLSGQEVNTSYEIAKLLGEYTPGNNIWYTRLLFQRLIIDQLKELADPKKTAASRKALERRIQKGSQSYWWKPGTP